MQRARKFLTAILCLGLLSFPTLVAHADTTPFACTQPPKVPKNLGTLVVAGQSVQLTSVEWGLTQGCFKKYGLTIKTNPVASAQIGIAGVIGASFDLALTTPTNLIQAMTNGDFAGKIVAPRHLYTADEIARAKREPLYSGELLFQTVLLVKKDSPIKSWSDLEKRKIAIKTFRSQDHAGVLLGMQSVGANSYKTEFLTMSDAQMTIALNRGDVDAIVQSDPYATETILGGARVIGYPSAYYVEPGPASVFISSENIVAKKVKLMETFQKAMLEINHLLNQSQYESSFRETIAKITGVSQEAAAKVRLPIMMERNVAFKDIGYIPNKLKLLGFTKTRVSLARVLFR